MSTRPTIRLKSGDVSARKTYDLMDEPVNEDYRALLSCALAQCDTAVLSVDSSRPLSETGGALMDRLKPFVKAESSFGTTRLVRLRFDREAVELLGEAADGLYGWGQPARPENLSLLRSDGSPWLVSIGAERLGYVELAPFEKLLLGRAAPGLAAVLAHQGARDAILASFERRLEAEMDHLQAELTTYGRTVVDEGRDGLADALRDWLDSGEHDRVVTAVGVIGDLVLTEMREDIADLLGALQADELGVPAVYRSNFVLRERWRARFERQLRDVLQRLEES